MSKMRVSPVAIVMLVGAGMDPGFSSRPLNPLLRAASDGDVGKLRKAFLKTPIKEIDLDTALSVAASRSHINAMAFLVDMGADDLNRALVQAARFNHLPALRWLLSEERASPADAFEDAQKEAAATGSTDAEWAIVSIARLRERQRRQAEDWDMF